MNEQIQTIIDRARAVSATIREVVSAAAWPIRGSSQMRATAERALENAASVDAVCDALRVAEQRAEEAEAQAAAMREALKLECDARLVNAVCGRHAEFSVVGKSGGAEANACEAHAQALMESEGGVRVVRYDTVTSRALSGNAGRALLDRLHAAEAKAARLEDAEAERDEVVSLLGEIREFARMKSDGPAVCDELWEVKEMADTFIMRNAPQPGVVIVEGVAQRGVMIPDELPRVAPVQGEWKKRPAGTVPWDVYLRAFETYHRAFSAQTAERIAERGGFGYREMQCLLAGHYGFGCNTEHAPVPGWVEKLA